VFDALHRQDKEIDGEDLRPRPLSEREWRPPAGVVFNQHTDENGG
jgi:hypothetical protein